MMTGFRNLGIPFSAATVDLTAFGIAQLPTQVPAALALQPVLPGRETLKPTNYAFLVSSAKQGKKVLFDLGPRKDTENFAPATRALTSVVNFNVQKDVIQLLHEAETPLEAINAVIWSHSHFDHVGDMSKFPSSTELFLGPGTLRDIFDPATNPNGTLLASDFADRKVTDLDFTGNRLHIGGFPALDYFKDGSFYLLDSPGHAPGHIMGLARVKPNDFVLLAGDTFLDIAQVRPTAALHKAVHICDTLSASARDNINTTIFRSGGNDTEGFDFNARSGPFFDVPEQGLFSDPAKARRSQRLLQAFDSNDDVIVVGAHDATLNPLIGERTNALNDWKQLNLKWEFTWQFVNVSEPSFRLSPA
ncbi:beta-lactamase-like protein [Flagelloscypha sp. PMI_526]|nr:beta-lactamase-like protein [Flagelloscypha sp. PMI_526]